MRVAPAKPLLGSPAAGKPAEDAAAGEASFTVSGEAARAETSAIGRASAPSVPLAALLSLQAAPNLRSRMLARGRRALHRLDQLQKALAGAGRLDWAIQALAESESLEKTGDEGLDKVLLEIETRAEVERAKYEMRASTVLIA